MAFLGGNLTLRQQESRLAYIFLMPSLLVVLGVIVFPLAYNIWLSVHRVSLMDLGEAASFKGIDNFKKVVSDPGFIDSLGATLAYAGLGALLSVFFGLLASLLLNRVFFGRRWIRGVILFPYIAPVAALAFLWRWLLNPVYGVFNWLLLQLNLILSPVAWLSVKPLALMTVIFFEGWRYFPFVMIFILARLQTIPSELYEAVEIDGGGRWRKFFHITLPELRYVLAFIFLIRFLWTINKFDDVFLLTSGAAGTKILPLLIYDYSFRLYDFGMGAAASIFLFAFLVIFIILYGWRLLRW